jgi:serine/threonine protein phosphatase PrpC
MHIVNDKDVVIVASDGIFDNIFDEDILKCLQNKNWIKDGIEN